MDFATPVTAEFYRPVRLFLGARSTVDIVERCQLLACYVSCHVVAEFEDTQDSRNEIPALQEGLKGGTDSKESPAFAVKI